MFRTRIQRCRLISPSLFAALLVSGTLSTNVVAQTLPPVITAPAPDAAPLPEVIDDEEPGVVELAPPATMEPNATPQAPPSNHYPVRQPHPRPMKPYVRTVSEKPVARSIFHLMPTPRECMDGIVENYHEKKAYPTYFDDYLRNCFICCCPWHPSQCETPREAAMREYAKAIEEYETETGQTLEPEQKWALTQQMASGRLSPRQVQAGVGVNLQVDLPTFGSSRVIYPTNPYYFDPRDGKVYAAQGYGMPVGMPLAPNVEHAYNYSHGTPASRLTPISRLPVQP